MIARLAIAAIVVSAAVPAVAQDAYTVAPQAYRKQLENEWVRVTRVHYAPHEKISEHGHPVRPSIYIYLTDGGPVLFKHEHGISGELAATRASTKAGAYRMAAGRDETHIVDNASGLASDFLQVELKVPVDLKTFPARRTREGAAVAPGASKVEIDIPELRITRVVCTGAGPCPAMNPAADRPSLTIAFPSGDTAWRAAGAVAATNPPAGEYLVIEFSAR